MGKKSKSKRSVTESPDASRDGRTQKFKKLYLMHQRRVMHIRHPWNPRRILRGVRATLNARECE